MSRLSHRQHYLQIALNSDLDQASQIIDTLPLSERILVEVGTPLIKEYGIDAIGQIQAWLQGHIDKQHLKHPEIPTLEPYVVADLKCMDRAEREVQIAAQANASAAIALGIAPIETLNLFIHKCQESGLDSMIDMMNVHLPHQILRQLTQLPDVVILHRGVDETEHSQKLLPIHLINKVKGSSNVMVAVAGGDTPREVKSAIFNGANIVVVWKNFFVANDNTQGIVEDFLKEIK